MQRLVNVIQRYAWGSLTAIPQLLGAAPDGQPQAELWLGAHPSAPSQTPAGRRLDALIAEAPQRLLGAATVERFGPRLPFLLKVLAAAQPLSLQAHPSLPQARAGFAREEAAGVPRHAGHRNYKDENHKPEIICALTPFRALCGFRRVSETARLLRALGLDTSTLERQGLRAYFEQVMTLPKAAQATLVAGAVERAKTPVPGFEAECSLAVHLAAAYPGDVGLIGALLLNLVTLAPGEALFLGAGNLHAYLEGTGIELMANSDNVLRGGLTPKHVDVPELLSVLKFEDGPAVRLVPRGAGEAVYETPVPDFRLSRVEVGGEVRLAARGPQVLLVVEGEVTVSARPLPHAGAGEGARLKRGESVFIGADEGDVTLSGAGVVFRATPGGA
jgi:mannose-6-phosphate isomerase